MGVLTLCILVLMTISEVRGGRLAGFNNGLVSVQFEIIDSSGVMYMSMSGPPDIWFGVGLNNTESDRHAMKGTYAIIVTPGETGTVQEWILGDQGDSSTQKKLSNTITVSTNTVEGGIRTVVFWRNLVGETPEHKTFSSNGGKLLEMPLIEATGSSEGGGTGAIFGNHFDKRGSYTMNFTTITRAKLEIIDDVDVVMDFYSSSNTIVTDELYTTITGPSTSSFSVSFGDDASHSFIVSATGDIAEYKNNKKLPSVLKNINTTTYGDNRRVSFERPAMGPTEDYYHFEIGVVSISYEISINNKKVNSGNSTIASIHRTTGSQNDVSKTVVALEISLCEVSNEMTLTLTGPSSDDTYFAVGFNATGMETKPWTIIVIGTVINEYHTYQDSDAGVTQVNTNNTTVGFTVISTSTTNGYQTVKISRPTKNSVFNSESFDFRAGYKNLPFISSHGKVTNGVIQYHESRKSSSITLDRISTYTANTIYTTKNGDLSFDLTIDEGSNHMVSMTLQGPDSKWFSVGFGSAIMNDTYAIVVHGNYIEERTLGQHTSGTNLSTQSITVVSDESVSGIRTVKLTRPVVSDTQHFDFNTKIPVYGAAFGIVTIAAVGQGSEFSYHAYGGEVSGFWLPLHLGSSTPPSPPPPPPPPTEMPTCDISDVRINPEFPDRYACKKQITRELSYHWKYDSATSFIYFGIENAAPGWVGITVPEAGHCGSMYPAKGVIGTHQSQMTYIVQSKGANAILKDHTQQTLNLTGSFDAGITMIRWVRKASAVPLINPELDTCFNYASNPSNQIGYHGPGTEARGSFKINLSTGTTETVSSPLKSKRITHGILMIAAWCWFVPLGILLKRYGKPVFSLGISQFYGHIALVMFGLVLTVASFILATSNGFGGGKYSHGTIGVAVLVLAGSNPIVGVLGYSFVRNPNHPKRWIFNITHWIIGRGVYLLATVQCFFGIESLNAVEGVDRSPYLIAVISGIVMSITTFFICDALVTQFIKRKDEVLQTQREQIKAALLE